MAKASCTGACGGQFLVIDIRAGAGMREEVLGANRKVIFAARIKERWPSRPDLSTKGEGFQIRCGIGDLLR